MATVRWPGKPTSGRYVYQDRFGPNKLWTWQCDLHPDWEYDMNGGEGPDYIYGEWVETMEEAFAGAMEHALYECGYSND